VERDVRVLVTGSGGQLGTEVVSHLEAEGDTVVALTHGELDVTDRAAVFAAVAALRPDTIINCAAWTAVDACESNPERALLVNANAPQWLAEAAAGAGSHLVHLSTDYVFSGDTETPYTEDDLPSPINVYGESKLAGETAVLQYAPMATLVRTSWVCGAYGNNVVKTVLGAVAAGTRLRFVDDQWGSPTFTHDLAPLLRRVAAERVSGVLHASNAGVLTWYSFVRSILAAAGHDPALVEPIATTDLDPPRPARRPRFSALANTRLAPFGTSLLPHFESSLHHLVRAMQGR